MELGWSVNDCLPDEVTKFEQEKLIRIHTQLSAHNYYSTLRRNGIHIEPKPKSTGEKLRTIIDKLGGRSARAQGLPSVITSFDRIHFGDRQTLYVLREKDAESDAECDPTKVFGFIKVGYKPLFLLDSQGNQFEVRPLCVLDFYVVEEMQRKGCGKKLFDFMILDQKVRPASLAVDRPSPKFKSFLRKHYSLAHTIPQVNNFVIFDGFFRHNNPRKQRNRLTDDFKARRRYQQYFMKPRNSESALPRLNHPRQEKPTIPKNLPEVNFEKPERLSSTEKRTIEPVPHRRTPVNPGPEPRSALDQPQSINRNVGHVAGDALLQKRTSQIHHRHFSTRSSKDENFAANLAQWHPRNNPRQRSNHAFGSARQYSRHNSAFNIFGRIDGHH